MKRFAKILCGFGSIEILCALGLLFVFNHIPSPWGIGTIGGGMSSVGDESAFDRTAQWDANVFCSTLGAAFSGVLFFVVGSVLYLFSRFKPKAASI